MKTTKICSVIILSCSFALLSCTTPAKGTPINKSVFKKLAEKIMKEAKLAREKKRKKEIRKQLELFLAAGGQTIDPDPCMSTGGVNSYYLAELNFPTWAQDRKQYQNVIIGDSTAAINTLIQGWLDSSVTQSVAVGGNQLCHYVITFRKSINTTAPQNVIVSTLGGNDLLAGHPDKYIFDTASKFYKMLRERFPKAKLIAVGVHPTRVNGANSRKDKVNATIKAMWSKDSNTCYVDPITAFGKKPGEGADIEQLYPEDIVHYTGMMALKVHEQIVAECKINF